MTEEFKTQMPDTMSSVCIGLTSKTSSIVFCPAAKLDSHAAHMLWINVAQKTDM